MSADAEPEVAPAGGGGGGGGGWAIPLMCLGLGLLACVVLIPAADESRRLADERDRLVREVDRLQAQVDRNDEFLHRFGRDAELGAVVAERHLGRLPEDVGQVSLSVSPAGFGASPYAMLEVPEPPEVVDRRPAGGRLAGAIRDARLRGWLLAGAALLIFIGLLGGRGTR